MRACVSDNVGHYDQSAKRKTLALTKYSSIAAWLFRKNQLLFSAIIFMEIYYFIVTAKPRRGKISGEIFVTPNAPSVQC